MPASVTVVSNGHGEDAIGSALARELRWRRSDLVVQAFPLVGAGRAYAAAGIAVLGPKVDLPSGGLTLHSRQNLLRDLEAGWVRLTSRQARDLFRLQTDVLLVVGDLFAQSLAALAHSRTRFLYQPLVSVRMAPPGRTRAHRWAMERFTYPERVLMRHRAHRVYVRDEPSAAWLRARGVTHAMALGNPAVDAVASVRVADAEAPLRVALLPGSRAHASRSLARMLEAVAIMDAEAVVAWAFQHPPKVDGWAWSPAAGEGEGTLARGDVAVEVRRGDLAGTLCGARLALGTAGTAVEQAAAAGVPVISFEEPPEHTREFLRAQQRLLGRALTIVEPEPTALAAAARTLGSDAVAHRAAASDGRERMGPAGGTVAIAQDVLREAERRGALSSGT